MLKTFPPKQITIKSDGNVLTYKEMIKPVGGKDIFYTYEYTKSKIKKGMLLGLTKTELENLIKANA